MNRSILESRLREALHNKKLENLDQFYKMLTSDSEVLKEFLDAVTTNLTRFFRNLPHFETLEQYVIPELVKIKALLHLLIRVRMFGRALVSYSL